MHKVVVLASLLTAAPAAMPASAQKGPPLTEFNELCLMSLDRQYVQGGCGFPTRAECQQFIAYVRLNEGHEIAPISPRCEAVETTYGTSYEAYFDLPDS